MIQYEDLYLAICKAIQIYHQLQLAFDGCFALDGGIQKHGDIYVAQVIGLPARRGAEQVSGHHVRLVGKISGQSD